MALNGKPRKTKKKKTYKHGDITDKMTLKLWRDILMFRCYGVCQYPGCNETKLLNSHHVVDRSYWPFRYEIKNGLMFCPLHHSYGVDSIHKNPLGTFDVLMNDSDTHKLNFQSLMVQFDPGVKIVDRKEFIKENYYTLKKLKEIYEQEKNLRVCASKKI